MAPAYYQLTSYNGKQSLGYLLRRAFKMVNGRLEGLFTNSELSFTHWIILMRLREGLGTTAAELSQNLCHDSGALTRIIDQLEERGLLQRERSKTDRRMVSLSLTEAGRQVAATAVPPVVALYNTMLEDFSAAEQQQLIDLLTRLNHKLSSLPDVLPGTGAELK